MKIKKTIKKTLSFIVPKGYAKEKVKLMFYNLNKPKNTVFEILKIQNKTIFITTFEKTTLLTNEGLYAIVEDFNYYQHFYKVKNNDIVLDAGANVGHLSIFFSKKVGAKGQIYSFEPDNHNIKTFKKNIELNEELENNISIHDLLLWNENKVIDFEEAGSEGSSAVWFSGKNDVVKKQAVTIDSWISKKNIKQLDFIKMDIEGAEIEALEGCVETIKKLKPNFAIASYHIVNDEPTYIKVESFFKKLGYPYKTITFRKNEIITFAGNL